jgi:hypothetical protein
LQLFTRIYGLFHTTTEKEGEVIERELIFAPDEEAERLIQLFSSRLEEAQGKALEYFVASTCGKPPKGF